MTARALIVLLALFAACGQASGEGNPVKDDAAFPFGSLDDGKRFLADNFAPVTAADGVTLYFDDAKIHTWYLLEAPDGASTAIIRSRTGRRDGRIADLYRVECEGVQAWCEHQSKWHESNLRANPPPPPPPELMDLL